MKTPSRLRALFTIVVALAVLYFVIGGILCLAGWFNVQTYAVAGGIVGSIASSLGLISLSRPGLSQSDLDGVEMESFAKIADAAKEIEALKVQRESQQQELQTLEQQKQEMEVLVQRASLALFLKEQHRHYTERVSKTIEKSAALKQHLEELARVSKKIEALDEEIETDPNVDLLKSIMESAKRPSSDAWINDLPPLTGAVVRAMKLIVENVAESLRIMTRFP